jgi:hypothetical protein
LQDTSWAEAFEMKCISQKTEIHAMAEHIQQTTHEAPLSHSADDDN